MHDDQGVNQVDIGALELFQRELVIQVGLFVHKRLELPDHQVRRDALDFCHPGAVQGLKLRKAFSGELNSSTLSRRRHWRELLLETVLFRSREVSGSGRKIRVAADPFRREIAEEILHSLRIRSALLRRERGG